MTTHYIPARHGLMVSGHDFGQLAGGSTVTASLLLPGPYALVAIRQPMPSPRVSMATPTMAPAGWPPARTR